MPEGALLQRAAALALGIIIGDDRRLQTDRRSPPGETSMTSPLRSVNVDHVNRLMDLAGLPEAAVRRLARYTAGAGERGQLRQKYREGQEDQLSALGLVVNIVALWNTICCQAALDRLRSAGSEVATAAQGSRRSDTSTSTSVGSTRSATPRPQRRGSFVRYTGLNPTLRSVDTHGPTSGPTACRPLATPNPAHDPGSVLAVKGLLRALDRSDPIQEEDAVYEVNGLRSRKLRSSVCPAPDCGTIAAIMVRLLVAAVMSLNAITQWSDQRHLSGSSFT